MERQNKRALGGVYEERAAAFLEAKNYRILKKNFRCRQGEVDLIARTPDGYLVFAEVKYRSSAAAGFGREAVDSRKQHRICRAALFYLVRHGYPMETPCRFDVLEFDRDNLHHIENAFTFIE